MRGHVGFFRTAMRSTAKFREFLFPGCCADAGNCAKRQAAFRRQRHPPRFPYPAGAGEG